MASPLLGIPKAMAKAASFMFFNATLTRETPTAGENAWTPGTPTTTTYSCKAIIDAWSAYHIAGGMVAAGDLKVLILANTLSVQPQDGDKITVRGETVTLTSAGGSLPAVSTDPAKAVWECRGRK